MPNLCPASCLLFLCLVYMHISACNMKLINAILGLDAHTVTKEHCLG